MAFPKSYKDSLYDELDAQTEQRLGLPSGLVAAIRTKGEKTNADQTSSAGAKTPYQFIPQTRDAIIEKYGIDPWLTPENASLAAGFLLRESLQRNQGNVQEAVGEYIGGTNRQNWGPVTQAYIKRVASDFSPPQQQAQGGRRLSQELGEVQRQPTIADAFESYQSGQMPPDIAAEFEADVQAGRVLLPAGAALRTQASQPQGQQSQAALDQQAQVVIPADIRQAYESGQMPPDVRAELEADIRAGRARFERTTTEEVGRQVGLTARSGLQAAGSVVGLFSDPIGALINQVLPEGGARAQTARSLAAQLADVLGLPSPETQTERVVGAITEGGLSAATGVGAASQAGRATAGLVQQGARVLAAEPAAQIAAGAGGAGAAQGVAEGGGGAVAQTLAALAAGAPAGAVTARLGAPRQAALVPDNLTSLMQQAEQARIPLMTSDVLPPETFVGRTAQATGERIPVAGTGPARQAQQQARVDAVRRISEEYGAGVGTRFDEQVSADLVKRRGEDLTRYTQLKDQVFSGVENAGAVPVPKAVSQIDKEIADLRKLGDAVPANVITELENFRNSIQNQGIRDLDKLRKILGDKLKSPELASARSVTDKIPSRVYGAVRDDIGEFVKSQGGQREYTKWRIANARLAQMADEADNVKLRNALNRGSETPETVNSLLFSKNRSDVARLYRNLTPDGRAAARSAVIQRAVEKAGGLENVSPQKFASEIERLSDQVGVLFNAQQKQQLDGLARVIKATQRASEAAASPPTGAQLAVPVGAAVLTDILGGFGAATVGGATIGGLARAYESKPVRDILLKLGATKPNSKQEGQLLRRIMPALVEFNRNQSQMSQERPNQGSRL